MGRLTAQERRDEPASVFAGPNRSFPIPDKGHAKAALREINHAPAGARAHIRAAAEAKLHPTAPRQPRGRLGKVK